MSLIKCRECGNEISDSATSCPKCGATNAGGLIKTLLPLKGWLLKSIFIISLVAFFLTNASVSLPVIGTLKISMYQVVKSGISGVRDTASSSDNNSPDVKEIIKGFQSNKGGNSSKENNTNTESSIAIVFLFTSCIGLMLHYLFAVIWGVYTLGLRKSSNLLNIVWLFLAVQFPIFFYIGSTLFMSAMRSEIVDPALKDNPFADIGKAMMQGISIDPGAITWVLTGCSVLWLAIHFWGSKKLVRVSTTDSTSLSEFQSVNTVMMEEKTAEGEADIRPFRKSLSKKLLVGFGVFALCMVILKFSGIFPHFMVTDKPNSVVIDKPIDIVGTYSGNGPINDKDIEISLQVNLNGNDKQIFPVNLSTTRPGSCVGQFEGIGKVHGDTLQITPPVGTKSEEGGDCVILAKFSKDGITTETTENNCSYFHGAACDFQGRLTKQTGVSQGLNEKNQISSNAVGSVPPPLIKNPAVESISNDDANDFIHRWLSSQSGNNVNELVEFYADEVDFFKSGRVTKAFIEADKRSYFNRWPERECQLIEPIQTFPTQNGNQKLVKLKYHFTVKNMTKKREGDAYCEIILTRESNDKIEITKETGNVIKRED